MYLEIYNKKEFANSESLIFNELGILKTSIETCMTSETKLQFKDFFNHDRDFSSPTLTEVMCSIEYVVLGITKSDLIKTDDKIYSDFYTNNRVSLYRKVLLQSFDTISCTVSDDEELEKYKEVLPIALSRNSVISLEYKRDFFIGIRVNYRKEALILEVMLFNKVYARIPYNESYLKNIIRALDSIQNMYHTNRDELVKLRDQYKASLYLDNDFLSQYVLGANKPEIERVVNRLKVAIDRYDLNSYLIWSLSNLMNTLSNLPVLYNSRRIISTEILGYFWNVPAKRFSIGNRVILYDDLPILSPRIFELSNRTLVLLRFTASMHGSLEVCVNDKVLKRIPLNSNMIFALNTYLEDLSKVPTKEVLFAHGTFIYNYKLKELTSQFESKQDLDLSEIKDVRDFFSYLLDLSDIGIMRYGTPIESSENIGYTNSCHIAELGSMTFGLTNHSSVRAYIERVNGKYILVFNTKTKTLKIELNQKSYYKLINLKELINAKLLK